MAEYPAPPVRETPTDPDAPDTSAHEAALDRFKLCEEAYHDQRARELEDLRFVDERGAQWPEDIRRSRGGQDGGQRPAAGAGAPVSGVQPPARPRPAGHQHRPAGEAGAVVRARGRRASRARLRRPTTTSRARFRPTAGRTSRGSGRSSARRSAGSARIGFSPSMRTPRPSTRRSSISGFSTRRPSTSTRSRRSRTGRDGDVRVSHAGPAARAVQDAIPRLDARELLRPRTDLDRERHSRVGVRRAPGRRAYSVRIAEYWEVEEDTETLVLLPDQTVVQADRHPGGHPRDGRDRTAARRSRAARSSRAGGSGGA